MEINFRNLNILDYEQFILLINQFRPPCKLTFEQFHDILNDSRCGDVYVVESNDKIIATGSICWKRGFIHDGKLVAILEDIIVDESNRGKGVGRFLIQHLIEIAWKDDMCYKIVLNCCEIHEPMYEKFGFKRANYQMEMRKWK
jgi:GNAT superfamily N-acetyltransferase